MADIRQIKVGGVLYSLKDGAAIHYTLNTTSVAGASKEVATTIPTTLYVPNSLIAGGTADAAGLITKGICGVETPDATGACVKSNLFINYDGDNNYSRKVVLGAGSVGTAITNGNGAYTYCAVRGDQMVSYTSATCYTKTEVDNLLDDTLCYEILSA